jgi:hypothetical protein
MDNNINININININQFNKHIFYKTNIKGYIYQNGKVEILKIIEKIDGSIIKTILLKIDDNIQFPNNVMIILQNLINNFNIKKLNDINICIYCNGFYEYLNSIIKSIKECKNRIIKDNEYNKMLLEQNLMLNEEIITLKNL